MIVFGADLCFTTDVFFGSGTVSPRSASQSPWNFASWSVVGWVLKIENWVRKVGGLSSKTFVGQKLAQFGRILGNFRFDSEYVWNVWRYSKSDKYFIFRDSSHVRRKKFGELWSINYGGLETKSYPRKLNVLEDHIFTNWVVAPPNFLCELEDDEILLAHTPPGMGVFLQFFSQWGSKIGLNFTKCLPMTLGG